MRSSSSSGENWRLRRDAADELQEVAGDARDLEVAAQGVGEPHLPLALERDGLRAGQVQKVQQLDHKFGAVGRPHAQSVASPVDHARAGEVEAILPDLLGRAGTAKEAVELEPGQQRILAGVGLRLGGRASSAVTETFDGAADAGAVGGVASGRRAALRCRQPRPGRPARGRARRRRLLVVGLAIAAVDDPPRAQLRQARVSLRPECARTGRSWKSPNARTANRRDAREGAAASDRALQNAEPLSGGSPSPKVLVAAKAIEAPARSARLASSMQTRRVG